MPLLRHGATMLERVMPRLIAVLRVMRERCSRCRIMRL